MDMDANSDAMVTAIALPLLSWTFAPSLFLLKFPLKTFILAKVAFIKTPFYLVVAARGLILP